MKQSVKHTRDLARQQSDLRLAGAWRNTNSITTELRISRDKIQPMPQRKLTFEPYRQPVHKKQYSLA